MRGKHFLIEKFTKRDTETRCCWGLSAWFFNRLAFFFWRAGKMGLKNLWVVKLHLVLGKFLGLRFSIYKCFYCISKCALRVFLKRLEYF